MENFDLVNLRNTLTRERNKLQRQEAAVAATKALIGVVEKQILELEKKK